MLLLLGAFFAGAYLVDAPPLAAQANRAASAGSTAGRGPLPDEVDLEVTERHYEVEARTIDEVVHRLNGMRLEGSGGRRSQGMTQYDIRPRYRAVAGGGICKLEGLSVEVRIVMTLPMWPGVVDRPEAEQEKWRTIAGAVRDHEHAHRDLSVQAAAELAESLRGREARGCGTLRQVVRGELSIHGARLREAHAAYDRETDRTLTPGRL